MLGPQLQHVGKVIKEALPTSLQVDIFAECSFPRTLATGEHLILSADPLYFLLGEYVFSEGRLPNR